jgi:hypothetical protein
MIPNPTQSSVQAALRSFLLVVLPGGTEVISGEINRVPEPMPGNFVVMTPIRSKRLRTNIDDTNDVKFTGSISGTLMTVTQVQTGAIEVGATVFGVGIADNTIVAGLGTGGGGIGTYNISPSQTVVSETLSSDAENLEQGSEWTVQLDFHSADLSAGDMAATASTLFRDDFAMQQFANQDPNYGVVPLLADDPKQMPFLNAENQYEWRWIVEALLQVNTTVSVPQQYADSAVVDVISVDATYRRTRTSRAALHAQHDRNRTPT